MPVVLAADPPMHLPWTADARAGLEIGLVLAVLLVAVGARDPAPRPRSPSS